MADVMVPQAAGESLLEQEHSADAAAEVSVPLGADKAEQGPPEPVVRGIYFVRTPRPALDDNSATIQKLQTELTACFSKLKAINNKFQVKKVRPAGKLLHAGPCGLGATAPPQPACQHPTTRHQQQITCCCRPTCMLPLSGLPHSTSRARQTS